MIDGFGGRAAVREKAADAIAQVRQVREGAIETPAQAQHVRSAVHQPRRLDLRESVREALLLELPITPYCREDCPGLCPSCGAELALGPCGCTAASSD